MHANPTIPIRLLPHLLLAFAAASLVACGGSGWNPNTPASEPDTEAAATPPARDAAATVARFKAKDPALAPYFESCHGYVVFPTVGKGGFWVGGAHGKGEVYEQGALVGTAAITQLTAGPQIGGQAYSEIIFFKDERTLREFEKGNFELGAEVSAIALDEGGAHHAAYDDGVAVFTLAKKGLMAEATVAGQKFSFEPHRG